MNQKAVTVDLGLINHDLRRHDGFAPALDGLEGRRARGEGDFAAGSERSRELVNILARSFGTPSRPGFE